MNFNNYLGRGISDYLYAKDAMNQPHLIEYNWPAIICAQAVEKILKAVIESEFADDSTSIALLKTHNLRTVVNKILTRFPESKISSKDCKWLGDFYYDARYPGDDFIEVSRDDALDALQIVQTTLAEVKKIMTSPQAQELIEYAESQAGTK